jgi:hypothetical protein
MPTCASSMPVSARASASGPSWRPSAAPRTPTRTTRSRTTAPSRRPRMSRRSRRRFGAGAGGPAWNTFPPRSRPSSAGGYVREDRLTVMALSPKELRPVAVPAGFELLEPESDEEILGLKGAQNEAYGDPPPDASTVAAERAFRASGGLSVLARSADGEPAGGGGCTAPEAGLRELAGVGVRARALSPAGPGTGDRLVAAGAGLRTGHEPSLADARGSGGGAHLPRPQDPCFGGRAPRPPRPLRQRVQRGGTCGAGKTHPGRGRGGDEG